MRIYFILNLLGSCKLHLSRLPTFHTSRNRRCFRSRSSFSLSKTEKIYGSRTSPRTVGCNDLRHHCRNGAVLILSRAGTAIDEHRRMRNYILRVEREGVQRVKMFLVITAAYVIFWGPLFFVTLVHHPLIGNAIGYEYFYYSSLSFSLAMLRRERFENGNVPKILKRITLHVAYVHAFVNPSLFLVLHKGLRTAALELCCGCCVFIGAWVTTLSSPPPPSNFPPPPAPPLYKHNAVIKSVFDTVISFGRVTEVGIECRNLLSIGLQQKEKKCSAVNKQRTRPWKGRKREGNNEAIQPQLGQQDSSSCKRVSRRGNGLNCGFCCSATNMERRDTLRMADFLDIPVKEFLKSYENMPRKSDKNKNPYGWSTCPGEAIATSFRWPCTSRRVISSRTISRAIFLERALGWHLVAFRSTIAIQLVLGRVCPQPHSEDPSPTRRGCNKTTAASEPTAICLLAMEFIDYFLGVTLLPKPTWLFYSDEQLKARGCLCSVFEIVKI
ncbi:unnamed protein product [Nesidiocoris tenuis]|uniref:Uncharacterized protein n=1 Tax=Nesidiocoris tenuis TaxID=355587 RepID=A0A6H5G5R7_9HEMI|nr:unnamed protein product [Nesidiocoris tenuis]